MDEITDEIFRLVYPHRSVLKYTRQRSQPIFLTKYEEAWKTVSKRESPNNLLYNLRA